MPRDDLYKPLTYVGQVLATLVSNLSLGAFRATKFISAKLVVRATLRRYRGAMPSRNDDVEIALMIGRPNAREQKFIKLCRRAGEILPLTRIQLQFAAKQKPKRKAVRRSKSTRK